MKLEAKFVLMKVESPLVLKVVLLLSWLSLQVKYSSAHLSLLTKPYKTVAGMTLGLVIFFLESMKKFGNFNLPMFDAYNQQDFDG